MVEGERDHRGGIRALHDGIFGRRGVADALRADLLERGRSLSELGTTLRWSDLRAFIRHLPPTSHFRRREDPERARRAELLEIHNQLLTKVHDAVWASTYARAGIEGEPTPLLSELLDGVSKQLVTSAPRKPQKSPSELRALVAERIRT